MKTFRQWQNFEARQLLASLDDDSITLADCRECRTVSQWLADEVLPAIELGQSLPYAVCRSLVDNGISLYWLAKHHEAKMPNDVLWKSGRKAD